MYCTVWPVSWVACVASGSELSPACLAGFGRGLLLPPASLRWSRSHSCGHAGGGQSSAGSWPPGQITWEDPRRGAASSLKLDNILQYENYMVLVRNINIGFSLASLPCHYLDALIRFKFKKKRLQNRTHFYHIYPVSTNARFGLDRVILAHDAFNQTPEEFQTVQLIVEKTPKRFWWETVNDKVIPGRAGCWTVPWAGKGELEELDLFEEASQGGNGDGSGSISSRHHPCSISCPS